jgi:hypothetical protein
LWGGNLYNAEPNIGYVNRIFGINKILCQITAELRCTVTGFFNGSSSPFRALASYSVP